MKPENSSHTITVSGSRGTVARTVADPVRRAVLATLLRHCDGRATIHVQLVNDSTMRRLNTQYLDHPYATDVLSFDLRDRRTGRHLPRNTEGDLVISRDTAAREARHRGHSLAAELALYAVHGTLHLLGFDDRTSRQTARMRRMEHELLTSLGWGAAVAPPLPRRIARVPQYGRPSR